MRSSTVMHVVGFALAFDFTVVAMSIQSYWSLTGGDPAHYGFAFGCYDLTQFLFIPLFGKVSDICGMKLALIVTLSLNILGNVMYALAFWFSNPQTGGPEGGEFGHWELILIGRLVAGCGSSALSLGITFFTLTTSIAERDEAITTYRIWQTVARGIATQAPMALTAFPTTISTGFQQLFNFYTIPGWITTMMSSVALVLVVLYFKSPASDETPFKESFSYRGAAADFRSSFAGGTGSDMGALCFHVIMFSVSGFCTTFTVFAIYSQLFAFAFAKYHLMQNMQDMYLVFMGLAIGATAGAIFFKMFNSSRCKAVGVRDYMLILVGNAFFLIGLASLAIPGLPSLALAADALFFIGTGFVGAGLIFFFPMCESFYTKKITQYQHAIPNQIGLFTAFMPASGALGRFFGPTVGSMLFTLKVNTVEELNAGLCGMNIDLQQAYEDERFLPNLVANVTKACPACSSPAESRDSCQDVTSLCNFDFPTYFFKSGCELDDSSSLMMLLAALFANLLIFCCYFRNHRRTPGDNSDPLTEPINTRGSE